tara:strand:- start:375 stop:599 length:225 start_codon:yes stop_codon:yes gene_type:complete
MDYIHYSNSDIIKLNKTNVWYGKPIKVEEKKPEKEQTYVLYATGYADMNGRNYIALPSDCDRNDPEIKKKYNLI